MIVGYAHYFSSSVTMTCLTECACPIYYRREKNDRPVHGSHTQRLESLYHPRGARPSVYRPSDCAKSRRAEGRVVSCTQPQRPYPDDCRSRERRLRCLRVWSDFNLSGRENRTTPPAR